MSRPKSNPQRAPEYSLYRIVTATDAVFNRKELGCNFGIYSKGCFQIVPINTAAPGEDLKAVDLRAGATSNPALAFRYWNEEFGLFLPHVPAQTVAASGAGVAYEIDFDALGRVVMLEVTGGVTGGQGVAIFAAAHNHSEAI